MKGNFKTSLSSHDLNGIKREITKQTIEQSFLCMLGLPLMALIDKYGWNTEQCKQFEEEVVDYYDEFNKGRITLGEIIQLVKDEGGVELVDGGKKARVNK